MQFTVKTLLFQATVFAVALAMIAKPNHLVGDLLATLHVIASCTSLVVARYTTGGVHAFALTFGIFGLVGPLTSACPASLEWWLFENVTEVGQDPFLAGGGPPAIISTCFYWLFALLPATIASSYARRTQHDREVASPNIMAESGKTDVLP